MCVRVRGLPAYVPELKELRLKQTLLLWKVLETSSIGHQSSMGMLYPLGEVVEDPNGRFGDHTHGIHLFPTRTAATRHKRDYGGHVVGVLVPMGRLWTRGNPSASGACWHADVCHPFWCEMCKEGVRPPQIVKLNSRQQLLLPDPRQNGNFQEATPFAAGAFDSRRLIDDQNRFVVDLVKSADRQVLEVGRN